MQVYSKSFQTEGISSPANLISAPDDKDSITFSRVNRNQYVHLPYKMLKYHTYKYTFLLNVRNYLSCCF